MKNKLIKNILSLILILSIVITAEAQDGNTIFKQNCATCHTIGQGPLIGPDLKNVHNKRSEEWLLKWTKSSLSLVRSEDSAAVAIFKEFNNVPMTDFSFLSDNEIISIFDYIKVESEDKHTTATDKFVQTQTGSNSNSEKTSTDFTPINPNIFFYYLWVSLIVILFLVVVWALTHAINTLSDALKEEYRNNKK